MRKKLTSIVVAMVVITGAAVLVMWPARPSGDVKGDDPIQPRGERVSGMGKEEELEPSSVRRSERETPPPSTGKPPVPEVDRSVVLAPPEVTKIASRIEKMMLDDEAARTKLVKEEKKGEVVVYHFETTRREGYGKFLDELLRKEAEAAGVDAGTLGGAVRHRIGHLDIPEGYQQLVQIKVPLDPKQKVQFGSYAVRPEDVGKQGLVTFQNYSGGSVPAGSQGWRYSRLLDLGNP